MDLSGFNIFYQFEQDIPQKLIKWPSQVINWPSLPGCLNCWQMAVMGWVREGWPIQARTQTSLRNQAISQLILTTQTFFVLIKYSSLSSIPVVLVDLHKDPQIMNQDNCRKLYIFWILLFHKVNTTQIQGWPIYDSRWPFYAFLRYIIQTRIRRIKLMIE